MVVVIQLVLIHIIQDANANEAEDNAATVTNRRIVII